MAGVVKVLLATVTVASSVHSQDMIEGCIVERGLQRTVFDRTLRMLVAEPLDQRLQVVTPGSKVNCILNVTLGNVSDPLPLTWTPATLSLYPRLELMVEGHPAVSATCSPPRAPTRLVMVNVLAMIHCPQGESIWRITPSKKSVAFHVGERASLSIVTVTEVETLLVKFDGDEVFLCMKAHDVPYLHKGRKCVAGKGLKPHVPLNLQFILSTTEYQIMGNGHRLRTQTWSHGRSATLEFLNKKKNATATIYVTHHLPVSHQATAQDVPVVVAMLSVVVAVLSVVCLVLLMCLLWRSPALSGYRLWKRSHAGCESLRRPEDNSAAHEEDFSVNTSKKTLPHPPPRPPNTMADISLEHKVEDPQVDPRNDFDAEYVKAKEVKPIEVKILKQQNIILGHISHQASPPWSPTTVSSQNSTDGLHHTVSRHQSISKPHGDDDNINIRVEESHVLREASDIYETVDDTLDINGYFRLGDL